MQDSYTVQLASDGLWQWCARPPYGDSVYGGFGSEDAARADARAQISAQYTALVRQQRSAFFAWQGCRDGCSGEAFRAYLAASDALRAAQG